MNKEKRIKIPPRFRRPLSKRKYRSMLEMLSDKAEISLLQSVFSLGEDGNYHYQISPDRKIAESAATLLKKIHRGRSGPNLIRISFVAVIIGLPILFNVLFLDKLAARQLEKLLESLVKTDVTVEGLDIAPLKARISLNLLGFASKSDPMVDRLQIQNVVSDVSLSALSFRRFVVEELRSASVIDVARKTPAVYPATKAKPQRKISSKFSGTDWMPSDAIPDEAVKQAMLLKETYEAEYDSWVLRVEKDIESVKNLNDRVESLISAPMPESVDGWIARVEEGRGVAVEINSNIKQLESYKRDLDAALRDAMSAFESAKAALERDLDLIEKTFRLDEEILNLWLQSVIDELAGPTLGNAYRQVASNFALADFLESEEGKDETRKKGRMKQGRIVQFPVRLPPRFSIENLNIAGEGVHIVGENIGIDHDLAGAPSHLLVALDRLPRFDTLAAEITVDGRAGADDFLLGRVDFDGCDWLINYDDGSGGGSSIGGLVGANTTLSAAITPDFDLRIAGLALLTDWKGFGGEGFFSFVQESSPPLGFQFETRFSEESLEFKISVIKEYLQDWIALLSDTLLLEGKERARQLLEDNVNVDLEDFDAFLVDWNKEGELLDIAFEQLLAQNVNLEESIAEWTEQATGGIVPSSELLEGLKSLF